MKTINQKSTHKQEAVTAAFVVASLISFFALVTYNFVTHCI